MPVLLGEISPLSGADYPPRKRWTRAEVELHENSGAFDGLHYELVEGDLINKMGKKRPHYATVATVVRRMSKTFDEVLVFPETPIDVAPQDNPTSHPEPDVLVLRRPLDQIAAEYAQPQDIALLIEVADSTVKFDVTVKAELYARAEISEYWVLDVNTRRLIVHREPESGTYKSVVVYSAEENVVPLGAVGQSVAVSDLLG